eukprot:CAMPEP_0170464568 /NCGR_PEP_ID=MMETSP0123-20130129/9243_1 /TAXON_ID=182087 /ORGANISM="Favella ehrenbergii, Strain Fehren 1" /LENGTH=37 /DNA_ID= /DNA_START= /DNA_END= /DNA_ORIENTATION=
MTARTPATSATHFVSSAAPEDRTSVDLANETSWTEGM